MFPPYVFHWRRRRDDEKAPANPEAVKMELDALAKWTEREAEQLKGSKRKK
jgi:hypothetical protein